MSGVTFTVAGRPQQRGSKRAMKAKSGKVLMIDAHKSSGPGMDAVAHRAAEAMNGRPLLQGPLKLWALFTFKRPKAHYRKNGTVLRDDAPCYHGSTPDADKLLRALGDAMTGVVYGDDRQLAKVEAIKTYTESSEGVEIIVSEM
jgi:Holliday junction resolvase RusA-like endonuclease